MNISFCSGHDIGKKNSLKTAVYVILETFNMFSYHYLYHLCNNDVYLNLQIYSTVINERQTFLLCVCIILNKKICSR